MNNYYQGPSQADSSVSLLALSISILTLPESVNIHFCEGKTLMMPHWYYPIRLKYCLWEIFVQFQHFHPLISTQYRENLTTKRGKVGPSGLV